MKKFLAVALLCALALALVVPYAGATVAVKYKTVGPIPLRIGYGAVTGSADSVARNFNTACVGGSVDTTVDIPLDDIVWGAVSDSLPIFVVVRRIGGTGGSADSVQVGLQMNWGGAVYAPVYTDTGNDWGGSTFALVGTGTGGAAFFWPATTGVVLESTRGNHHIIGPCYGAEQARILCRSISVAASAGRFSVFLRYPARVQ
jgi:hypothetical protein